MCWSSGMVYAPTRLVLCPSRLLSLVCKRLTPLVWLYMPGRIWCSNATLSPGMDHDPWPCAVTREPESMYKRTRRTDTARRLNTSDAGFTRGLFPAKHHPCRLARDLWPLRTSLEISNNVFSSTEREPL